MKTTATFALLGAISLLTTGASAEMEKRSNSMGKHMKMAKRLDSDINKRNNDVAPFGYDHCGNPKKAQEKRHNGPSPSPHYPSPSPSYHACPSRKYNPSKSYGPSQTSKPSPKPQGVQAAADQTTPSNGQAEAAAGNDGAFNNASGNNDKAGAVVDNGSNNNDGAAQSDSSSWSSDATATWTSDAPSSTTTQTVDVTSTWTAPKGQIKVPAKASSTSSSVESWSSSSDSWTSSSSDTWTPEPSSTSSSEQATWTPPVQVGAAAPVVPAPSGNHGKVGLAWDWQNPYDAISKWNGASFVYTWSAFPPSGTMPDGMTWYPQYWGPAKQGDFEGQVAAGAIRPGMTILGWNEPDQPGQANMSIEDGIAEYKRLITPYAAQGYTLATPGCTSDDNGFNWISGFIAGCNGECGFSVLQTHFYGTDAGAFIAYIEKLHNAFGLPIIVSEYAAETFGNGPDLSLPETQAFLAATQAFLDSADYVLSYMFFGAVTTKALNGVNPNNLLITDSGDLTALGWQYLSS